MTHDDERSGTTTLCAALNILDGTVLGRCRQRHRHQAGVPAPPQRRRGGGPSRPASGSTPSSTPTAPTKHPEVRAWLARHPRWTCHVTPTSSSWLNAVETFFSALTRRRLKRGVFGSIVELQAAIHRYIAEHNDVPAPFVWTKSSNQIVDKLDRLKASVH